MHNRMIFDFNTRSEHNICYGGNCNVNFNNEIPIFYSAKNATDNGWRYTTDKNLLPEAGWLCPDCVKASGRDL